MSKTVSKRILNIITILIGNTIYTDFHLCIYFQCIDVHIGSYCPRKDVRPYHFDQQFLLSDHSGRLSEDSAACRCYQ